MTALRQSRSSTFRNGKANVLRDQQPGLRTLDFIEITRQSPWQS